MDLRRMALFCVGWLAYCSIFFIRKPMSLIKADLDFDNEYSALQLGLIDFAFLLPFCFGQVFLSYLGDCKNGQRILCASLLISSIPLALFFPAFNNFGFFFIMLMVLGMCQAPCWSIISRVLSQHFSSDYLNTALGIIVSASFIGGIAGALSTVYVQYTYGWTYVYIIPGIINAVVGFTALLIFKETTDVDKEPSPVSTTNRYPNASPSFASALELCSNRSVLLTSLSIFVVRLVRFAMYMWVPYFLLDEILYPQVDSGLISIAFEGGGALGSLFFDKLLCRKPVICVLICNVLTAIAIKMFHTYCYHIVHAILWLAIIGFFSCGADSLLSGSIANEIGESMGATGTVVGFINGIGTLGAVVEGPFFSLLLMLGGWDTAFLLCIILLAAASTLPLLFYPGIFSPSQIKLILR